LNAELVVFPGRRDYTTGVEEFEYFRRSPDFDLLKKQLKQPVIFDGRNLYDPAYMKKLGFRYYAIGRGEA
jgi:UDPglucose 6-dehydrogenase